MIRWFFIVKLCLFIVAVGDGRSPCRWAVDRRRAANCHTGNGYHTVTGSGTGCRRRRRRRRQTVGSHNVTRRRRWSYAAAAATARHFQMIFDQMAAADIWSWWGGGLCWRRGCTRCRWRVFVVAWIIDLLDDARWSAALSITAHTDHLSSSSPLGRQSPAEEQSCDPNKKRQKFE